MTKVRLFMVAVGMVFLLCISAYAVDDPCNPTPSDEEEGVNTTVTLEWDKCTWSGDNLTYEVWMRRVPANWGNTPYDNLSLAQVGAIDPIEDPDDRELTMECLMPDTTYVWQVIAIDESDPPEPTEGPRWSFTTNSTIGEIYGIEPNSVKPRETLRIYGCGFRVGTAPLKVKIGSKSARINTRFGDKTIKYWSDELIQIKMKKRFFTKNGMSPGETKNVKVKVIQRDGAGRIKYVYETPMLTLEWPSP